MLNNYSPKDAALYIQNHAPNFTPKLGLILGSGLGAVADQIENPVILSYEDIHGFYSTNVKGHAGCLHLGRLKGIPVVCMQGRTHVYEGLPNIVLQNYIRTLKLLGCENLLLTNAGGSLHADVKPGSLVLLNDHINLQFSNPLQGPNDSEYGDRFVSMEDAYDPTLRKLFHQAADKCAINLNEGVFIGVSGPCFETPAEIRAFKVMGADVVGMSTVPEVIIARHCGIKIAAISAITNLAAGMNEETLSHDQTLRGAQLAIKDLTRLILQFIEDYKL